jgi:hypothetical protein
MHHIISAALAGALLLLIPLAHSQPVTDVPAAQLLAELPTLPATPAEAHRRCYPSGTANRVGAEAFYKPWSTRLEKLAAELQQQQVRFYQQYPTGIRPTAPPPNRASAAQQASMNDAMAEFAAKMQSDPAFAQAFAKKSEAEQQAYVQQLLADNGLKPATGTPNMPVVEEEPVNWVDLMTTMNTEWASFLPAHSISNVIYKAEQQHARISEKLSADIEKVPMIEMGEYGRDHDPELVKALQDKALEQHRQLAGSTLLEGRQALQQLSAKFLQLYAPYHAELQKANFGRDHDFGMYYSQLLGQQLWVLQQLDQIAREAILLTDHVADWEHQAIAKP